MYVVINRWLVDPERTREFQEGWTQIIERNISRFGGLGSRLHRADDGTWVSYSVWPDRQHWQMAWELDDSDESARQKMLGAILNHYEPVTMVPVLDHLLASRLPSD